MVFHGTWGPISFPGGGKMRDPGSEVAYGPEVCAYWQRTSYRINQSNLLANEIITC